MPAYHVGNHKSSKLAIARASALQFQVILLCTTNRENFSLSHPKISDILGFVGRFPIMGEYSDDANPLCKVLK